MQTFGGSPNQQAARSEAARQEAYMKKVQYQSMRGIIMDNLLKQRQASQSEAEAKYTNQRTLREWEETKIKEAEKLFVQWKTATGKDKEYFQKELEKLSKEEEIMRFNLGLSRLTGTKTSEAATPSTGIGAFYRATLGPVMGELATEKGSGKNVKAPKYNENKSEDKNNPSRYSTTEQTSSSGKKRRFIKGAGWQVYVNGRWVKE